MWFAGCAGIALLALVVALGCMTRELEKPMLGPHSFRQTQTAISAFYMAQNPSMFLDYITPVLGPPWKIPMELPLYQWIVARWHNLTGMPLDPSGKLISIAAWLLCLAPVFAIGRFLRLPPEVLALTAAIALASPLYLFWGAAFLMETTGLLFALLMVAFDLRARMDGKFAWLALAVLFGSVAAMLKATTWAVASGTGILHPQPLQHSPIQSRPSWGLNTNFSDEPKVGRFHSQPPRAICANLFAEPEDRRLN
jgi:hypothetical protein